MNLNVNNYIVTMIYQNLVGYSSTSYKVLFYSNSILSSNNRFKVTSFDFGALTSNYSFTEPPQPPSLPLSLIIGLRYVSNQPNSFLNFTSNTASNSFNVTLNEGTYGIQWVIISKVLCSPPNNFYLTSTNMCNSTCSTPANYITNGVLCRPCLNSRCLTC